MAETNGANGTNGAGPRTLTLDQIRRYQRQIIMPEVGSVGQRKLLDSSVVLVGAGGLGSPAALYLGAAGVGTLGIIDFDTVDVSNLHRQVLHGHSDVGRPKVDSAADTLRDINPDIKIKAFNEPISSENAFRIFEQFDVVVNGSDNFPTRYLVNDACYFLKKPLVDGSIFRFEGQATDYIPGRGCYRCVFPEPPPPGAVPSCADAGVLGVLPGIVGSIQALETIKIILGQGEPLVNRMLIFDSLEMEFRQVKLHRDPSCPLCGDEPTVTELIDYEAFCGGAAATALS